MKKQKKEIYSEADVAKVLVEHYRKMGYEVFNEVSMSGGGSRRIDMYCKNDDHTIGIEVKLNMNLTVLEQGFNWRNNANMIYVAVPKNGKDLRFAKMLCEDIGLGILTVSMVRTYNTEGSTYKGASIEEILKPAYNENIVLPKLYEEQKESIASNATGSFVTPFSLTRIRLVEYIRNNGPSYIKDVLEKMEHHYQHNTSAVGALSGLIKSGVINELVLYKEGNKNFIKLKQ
jgi:hypothetical protein